MSVDSFEVASYKHPLKNEGCKFYEMREGATVLDIVNSSGVDPKFYLDTQVIISKGLNFYEVPFSQWSKVRPKNGSHVLVTPRVEGAVAALVLGALIPSAATFIAGSFFAAGTLAFTLTYAAVTIVGGLLVQSLIPPPAKISPAKQDDPNFSITGSANAENRYGVYPTVLGRHMMYPPKTARGYTEGEGSEIYYRGRFAFGFGPVALESLRIGTTPITEFEGVEIELLNVDREQTLSNFPELEDLVTNWRQGSESMSLYPDDIAEETYSARLERDVSVVRSTRDRAISASVDVTYQGLVKFDSNNKTQRQVSVRYRYRRLGETDWIDAGTETHSGSSTANLRFTKEIQFPSEGEYDIELTRTTEDSDETTVRDDAFLSAIRSVQAGELPSHEEIAEIAIRVKASDQLNGQLDSLNGVVLQMGREWNGTSWSDLKPIRHPAWIYARCLSGPSIKDPVQDSRIQLDDLKSWADEEPHWTCDAVIDQPTTTAEILDLVCASGRARRTLRDLKYSVIRDGGAGPIVQQFNPRNSWGFTGSITFPKEIHGFIVRCLSERLEWQQDEITVYADGYDESNATEFETLELRGVVLSKNDASGGNAWRLGRYHLAQAKLRPESFEWSCDIDHLRVNMGDKVRLVHDVPLIGVGVGRMTRYETNLQGNIAAINLDELFSIEQGSYRLVLRKKDGSEIYLSATPPVSTDGRWIVSGEQSPSGISIGDMVSIEKMSEETMEVLVTGIRHNGDLKATITGVPAAPEVLNADKGSIPEYTPNITKVVPREGLRPASPKIRSVVNQVRRSPARVVAAIEIEISDKFFIPSHIVSLTDSNGKEVERQEFTGLKHEITIPSAGSYELKVFAKDANGKISDPSTEQVQYSKSFVTPQDVSGFTASHIESQTFLSWNPIDDDLFSHFEIKFIPSDFSLKWFSTDWIRASRVESDIKTTSYNAPSLDGWYLIKAFSIFGEQSVNAATVQSSPSGSINYNAIQTVQEDPSFSGTKDSGLSVVSQNLQLAPTGLSSEVEKNYYFGQTVDLSEVYNSRLIFLIETYGYREDNQIQNWTSLDSLSSISGVEPQSDKHSAKIQIRTTEDDPNSSPVWSEWEDLKVNEYSARAMQFRINIKVSDPTIGVKVSKAKVTIDMPDRTVSSRNVSAPASGVDITFSPAFKEVPAVFINASGLPTGAVSEQINLTRSGFQQRFNDKDGNAIAAVFDWQAIGFGREI